MEIVCVTVDCADPDRVAQFWNSALTLPGQSVSLWYLGCPGNLDL